MDGGIGSLLGGTVGFIGSAIPKLIEVWQRKEDRKHEISLRKLEMDAAAQGHQFRVVEKNVDADIAETTKLLEHDMSFKGGWFMDAVRASVRPVITYVFFLLYLLVKLAGLKLIWDQNIPLAHALPLIWDGESAAIFAAIVAFWFGQRAMARFRVITPTTTRIVPTINTGSVTSGVTPVGPNPIGVVVTHK